MEDFAKYNGDGTPLRKAQLCMLNILIEIDRICRKHDIPYWLDSGTLLGAVRHGGFIPWDDDLDLCVLRTDYRRLCKTLSEELPNYYVLENSKTDKNFFDVYSRIKDKRTYCYYPLFEKQNSQGLWVDIVPLEKDVPAWYKTIVDKTYGKCYKQIYNIAFAHGEPKLQCAVKKLIAYCLFPFAYVLMQMGRLWGNCRNNGLLMHPYGSYWEKRRTFKNIFPTKEILFEGHYFYAPNNSDAYLRNIYGDYMQIPAPEKRKQLLDVSKIIFYE